MVHRMHKQKSCWHVFAIPQASIAAPTLTVTQGFEAKKKDCSVHILPRSFVFLSPAYLKN